MTGCATLARDIAGQSVPRFAVPGQIKVTVIRETREESIAANLALAQWIDDRNFW